MIWYHIVCLLGYLKIVFTLQWSFQKQHSYATLVELKFLFKDNCYFNEPSVPYYSFCIGNLYIYIIHLIDLTMEDIYMRMNPEGKWSSDLYFFSPIYA
jgi:hypothetical protein